MSTPLALNIYTAVHNPISVKGRLQLCKGALAHVDTRPVLSEIDIPVICVQSTQNNFVKPLHTDPYVSRRGGEVRSIHKARIGFVAVTYLQGLKRIVLALERFVTGRVEVLLGYGSDYKHGNS